MFFLCSYFFLFFFQFFFSRTQTAQPTYARCRQNSVFVESQHVSQKPCHRKYQSAMDLSAMVLDEAPEPV